MRRFGQAGVLSAALVGLMATTAGAQKACEVDEGSPSDVARATLQLGIAQQAAEGADVSKQLRESVKLTTDGAGNRANPAGRAFVLGKTLVMWMAQPAISPVEPRGKLGYTANPDMPLDMPATIDSLFTIVETANPDCAEHLNAWRTQKGWIQLVQGALEMVNRQAFDSAETAANHALKLSKHSPYGHLVLAQVAAGRQQVQPAIAAYKRAVEESGKDTVYQEVRRQILYNLGTLALDAAEIAKDTVAEKKALLAEAKEAFEALAKDPGKNYGDPAQQNLTRIALASGDKASLTSAYADKLANPSAFGFSALIQAGVIAASADQVADATKLFEAAYAQNPWHRDGLYNYGLMLIKSEQFTKAIPVIDQLVKVDPSNGDNYRLYTYAYAGNSRRQSAWSREAGQRANAAPAARKRAITDTIIRMKMDDSVKFSNEMAVNNNILADTMSVQVLFTEFTPGEAKTTIGGQVINKGKEAKSYTLKVEFLDKGGNVIATGEAAVGPVQPGARGNFSVVGNAANIAAFRYEKLH